MKTAILTVGDEVLAGDTPNTNATWLAEQITAHGSTVARILTLPDDRQLIVETVDDWNDRFDAVVITGGLGGTHDDVTVDALADVFDRELVVDPAVREDVLETAAAYRDANPDLVAEHDLDLDVNAWASLPEGARAIINPEGLCPGCVLGTVYAFPGVPAEMQALFETVAHEFDGDVTSRTLYTPQPEGSMVDVLAGVREKFDVQVGSYPDTGGLNRLKVSGEDGNAVKRAVEWLEIRVTVDRVV